jgi:ParB family transcriptional regulator, chromosome partitioning protein
MAAEKQPRRLGRGLEALFNPTPTATEEGETALRNIPVSKIRPNPFQPRKDFDEAELRELSESLQISGLLQPITVRPYPKPSLPGTSSKTRNRGEVVEDYELIAGERRLRAAAELGWTTISAMVKEVDDRELLALALIENLQRSNLNPIEEAEGYERLMSEFGHTQQSLATMVAKDRSTIANLLRILQLPIAVKQMLREGSLTVGQARPLLTLSDEKVILKTAEEIRSKGLSARDIEQKMRELSPRKVAGKVSPQGQQKQMGVADTRLAEVRALENSLRSYLQTDVLVDWGTGGKGTIKISFYSTEDLQRISELLSTSDRR